jgi:probable HAF family extracellular repeat protein
MAAATAKSGLFFVLAGFLVLTGVLGVAPASAQSPIYFVRAVTMTDLGTLGGAEASALDINELGEIVGWSTGADGRRRAFLYRDARMRDITAGLAGYTSAASSINAHSEIVGSVTREADGDQRAFFSAGGGPIVYLSHRLDPRVPAHCRWESKAESIADTGRVVGLVWVSSPGETPLIECTGRPLGSAVVQWRWPTAPVERILDASRYSGGVSDVNNHGSAAGWLRWWDDGAGASVKAVRWNGGVTTVVPAPPSSLTVTWVAEDYDHAYAAAVNDRGYVAGRQGGVRFTGGVWQDFVVATLWSGTSPRSINLGTLPTGRLAGANDVNEENFVAGYSDTTQAVGTTTVRTSHGFLWHKHFGMVALPRLWPGVAESHCTANALNDFFHGSSNEEGWVEVVGTCTSGAVSRAVRWDVRLGVR